MRKIFQSLIIIFCKLFALLPRPVIRVLGMSVGVLWYDIIGLRKKVIFDNLEIAFPEGDSSHQLSQEDKKRIARRSVYQMGAYFAEFFMLPSLDQKWLEKNVVFENLENLKQAQSKNKGVYLLGMHMGSGDLTASSISTLGFDLYLISKKFKNKFLNDLWFFIRSSRGVKFIDAHGVNNAFEILKAIKSKALVAFVLDQFMGRPYAVENTFFGRKTGTAYGLALFVMKTKSPVIPVYAYEGNDHKYHIVFEEELKLDHLISDNKEESILILTQAFNDSIESCIRKQPQEWMWVHRRWKEYE